MNKSILDIDIEAEREGSAIRFMNIHRVHRPNKFKQNRAEPQNYPCINLRKDRTIMANETNAEKFTRLANKRVNNALQKIGLIGNLSATQYEYTDDQIKTIEVALFGAVDTAMSGFNKAKIAKPTFSL